MRSASRLTSAAALAATGVILAAAIGALASAAAAGDAPPAPTCDCPDVRGKAAKSKFAELQRPLDESDEIAALQSVQLALSRVGDGTTFVWRRSNGRLAGLVKPTSSFRNAGGAICRHLVVLLTTGVKTKKAEGVACRLANGRWQLEG